MMKIDDEEENHPILFVLYGRQAKANTFTFLLFISFYVCVF